MKFQVFLIFVLLLVCYNSLSIEEKNKCLENEGCDTDGECSQHLKEKCGNDSPGVKDDKNCVFYQEYFKNEVKKIEDLIKNAKYYTPKKMKNIFYEDYKVTGEHKQKVDKFITDYTQLYNTYMADQNRANQGFLDLELFNFQKLLILSGTKQDLSDDAIRASYECNKKCGTLITNNEAIEYNKKAIKCHGTIPQKEQPSQNEKKSNSNEMQLSFFLVSFILMYITLI